MLSKDVIKEIQIILEHAPTWDAVQSQLYAMGYAYIRKGGGAVIRSLDNPEEIKASSVSRGASLFYVQKRLGPLPDGPSISLCRAIAINHTAMRKRLLALVNDAISQDLPSPESSPEISQILAEAGDYARHVAQEYWAATQNGKMVHPVCTISEVWLRHYLAGLKPTQAPPLSADAISQAMYELPDNLEFRRSQLSDYHKALQPDFYRVSVDQITYKEKYNVIQGRFVSPRIRDLFTRDQVYFRLAFFMGRSHIYYTPISDQYHYILVDDVSPVNLHNILTYGFKPACVWASSPGNFQGGESWRAGNRSAGRQCCGPGTQPNIWRREIQRRCACPPRPGFANVKEAYAVNGKAPIVHIIQARGDECGILARLYQWLLPHIIDAQATAETNKRRQPAVNRPPADNCCEADIAIYAAHHREVCENWLSCGVNQDKWDYSAIDAAVAERLRGTGHQEDDVARIIASGGAWMYERAKGRTTMPGRIMASGQLLMPLALRERSAWPNTKTGSRSGNNLKIK